MKASIIPKSLAKLAEDKDLVFLPRQEYEKLMAQNLAKPPKKLKEYTPTAAERRAIKQARLDYQRGNYYTLDEFKRKMGFTRS